MVSRASLRHPLRASLCGFALLAVCASARAQSEEPPHSAELDAAIIKEAKRNGVPEKLVRRIVMRESRYNPRARNHSFWGLMQISYPTAKSMGFKGTPRDLLNPMVNLTYAVPYLANAFVIAGKREDAAVRLYASGYYSTARQRGLLGLLRTAETAPVSGEPDVPAAPLPPPPQNDSIFGSLFGAPSAPQAPVQTASYAAASDAPAGPPAVALPQGKNGDDSGIDMTVDKSGAPHIPKKWSRDGGTTEIARGEQAIEQVAAFERAADAAPTSTKKTAHAPHKMTNFAALDQPPANAQAYAASAEGQDLRITRADSQAAIQQVTSGTPAPATQAGDPQAVATAQQGAPSVVAPETATDAAPAKNSRAARKSHAKKNADKAPTETKQASMAEANGDDAAVPSKRHKKHAAPKKSAQAEQPAATSALVPPAAQ